MEVKKSKKAEIESKRSMWLLMGFISVLACMFVAFEWTQKDKNYDLSMGPVDPIFAEELIPITFPEEKILPPPPVASIAADLIKVVDDDETVEETIFLGTEDDDTGVEIKPVAMPVEDDVEDIEAEFIIVEDMPSFPGGQEALMRYLGKNIKYPTIPQETGVQGRVVVQFVVDKDGSIVNPVVVRSIDPYLDKEAIRVIMSMPKWKPGMQRGKAVRVKYTVPVTFKLQ